MFNKEENLILRRIKFNPCILNWLIIKFQVMKLKFQLP